MSLFPSCMALLVLSRFSPHQGRCPFCFQFFPRNGFLEGKDFLGFCEFLPQSHWHFIPRVSDLRRKGKLGVFLGYTLGCSHSGFCICVKVSGYSGEEGGGDTPCPRSLASHSSKSHFCTSNQAWVENIQLKQEDTCICAEHVQNFSHPHNTVGQVFVPCLCCGRCGDLEVLSSIGRMPRLPASRTPFR